MKTRKYHIVLLVIALLASSDIWAQPDPPEVPIDGFSLVYLVIGGIIAVFARSRKKNS